MIPTQVESKTGDCVLHAYGFASVQEDYINSAIPGDRKEYWNPNSKRKVLKSQTGTGINLSTVYAWEKPPALIGQHNPPQETEASVFSYATLTGAGWGVEYTTVHAGTTYMMAIAFGEKSEEFSYGWREV